MTAEVDSALTAPHTAPAPVLELDAVSKRYGSVIALTEVSLPIFAESVTCVLGDNGAGKSTLIQVLSGLHAPSTGTLRLDGAPVTFATPRDARAAGVATLYQDLAVAPLMPVWRNFFLGSELTHGRGVFARLDTARMREITRVQLAEIGIDLRNVDQPIGTLSGGERQSVAIARAVFFGARVLILDEPTAALGVRQSGVVLRYILRARERGLAVVFITHNPHHAYAVGDRFVLLNRGRVLGSYGRNEISVEELTLQMSGGADAAALAHELRQESQFPAE